jgi:phosphomannomutase
MSGHDYFRDFAYGDSGMIPWLLVAEMLCRSGTKLSALIDERMAKYPASGEINRTLADPTTVLQAIEDAYAPAALSVSHIDGLSSVTTVRQSRCCLWMLGNSGKPLLVIYCLGSIPVSSGA